MPHNGNGISLTSNGFLGGSLGTSDHKKKIKTKRARTSWVEPLYGPQPNIIFKQKKKSPLKANLLKHMAFVIKVCHQSV
jgi:hypothetical protein